MSKVVALRDKVNSISRIHKMTEAMQVVAVAQLKGVQVRQRAAWHYRKHYDRLVKRLGITINRQSGNITAPALVYVFGSERGFCGSYNENLFSLLRHLQGTKQNIEVRVIGRKAGEVAKEHAVPNVLESVKVNANRGFSQAEKIAKQAYDLFVSGQVAEVYIIYNEFKSILMQNPTVKRIMPFDLSDAEVVVGSALCEPSVEYVSKYLAVNYIKVLFYDALLQAGLGEVAARLMTMRGATENSKEMIANLKIQLNKARQSMITVELAEIVSSFEILAEGEA